ncbi:unnamed protein product [Periconia digitata]|uniref:Zn(2)-C6 fungal-type domain-containing protein n=1 Tax=Periconia digitata TaxID=1303443 RepID=A0A9W4UHZ0_9PLEO|nr:unnamed protein product [Periconia digitata]
MGLSTRTFPAGNEWEAEFSRGPVSGLLLFHPSTVIYQPISEWFANTMAHATSSPAVQPPAPAWVHVAGSPAVAPAGSGETSPLNDADRADADETAPPAAKRRREDKERTRVSRACDRCKKKKTRCSGRCPCALCLKTGLPCEFTAAYTRGRLPSVIVDENAIAATPSTRPRVSMPATIPVSVQEQTPPIPPSPSFQLPKPIVLPPMNLPSPGDIFSRDRLTVPNIEDLDRSRDPPSRTSPEPPQTDLQGHYVGPASGVSFLLRIQKRLHQNSSHSHDSSIFTFGDAPLPEFDPTFFVLPPKDDARKLVARYFDFAAPTHRFLHRPSIEKLLDEFYETQGNMRSKEDAPSKTALLLVVMAQAKAYSANDTLPNDHSARYYAASEHQLSKERGAVRLASVQARLGQCFYLLSQSRVNHCWSLFGTMAHLAFAIGLNRGRRSEPSGTVDYIEVESRRRCFWIAYVLDKYLAAALGRPRTFKDEDIDQEFPTIVHDNDLLCNSITPAPLNGYEIPLSMAPIEHVKISRIIAQVLKDLYAINPPPTPSQRLALSAKHMSSLRDWRANLTRFLDTSETPSSVLIPIYQRQRNVLNLAYFHAVILINRPFLLSNFANLTRKEGPICGPSADTKENVQACLDAAMGIVHVIDDYSASGMQLVRAFWFTQYYAFCAVVVLYVYRIQQGIVDPGKCQGYFTAGQRTQGVLENISESDCLSKRYCLVLEELRLEAARHRASTSSIPSSINNGINAATAPDPSSSSSLDPISALSPAIPPILPPPHNSNLGIPAPAASPSNGPAPQRDVPSPGLFYSTTSAGAGLPTPESALFGTDFMSPDSIMADLTGWGQFDSLVTAGIGMMDGVGGFPGSVGGGGGSADTGMGFGFG